MEHITATVVGVTDGKWTTACIKTDCDDIYDLSRAVYLAFAASPRVILELSPKKGSLEDVFIELTEGAAPVEETPNQETVESEVEEA